MKLLPVYLNCVLKSDVLHPGAEVTTDDRAYARQLVTSMDVAETNVFFYPRLLPLVRLKVRIGDTALRKELLCFISFHTQRPLNWCLGTYLPSKFCVYVEGSRSVYGSW